ncbi:MAG: hypothetical protein R3253_16365, partial [Longimicrobiales bacterium]|nr:hypothetical protein [Longimicrobiales bacterium]
MSPLLRLGAGAAILLAVACSMSPRMERAVPVESLATRGGGQGGTSVATCPADPRPRAVSGPPDTTALRWYRAAEKRDVELSARWCATVGPPVFMPDPDPDFPEWTRGRDLEVFSWNVHAGGGDLFDFLRAETGLACRGSGSAAVSGAGPFVVLVQEAWRHSEDLPVVDEGSEIPWTIDPDRGPGGGADMVEVARRCGLALLYVPSARNGPDTDARPREDKGNAILSSLPLTTPVALDLPFEAG